MRRTLAALAVCAGLAVAVAPAAHAKEMNGKTGIGAEGPIASNGDENLTGLSVVRGLPAFNIQGIVMLNRISDSGDSDGSFTQLIFMPRILFPFITEGNAVVHIVGGLGLERITLSANDESESRTTIIIEGGVRPEWFVTEFISFHTQVGLAIIMVGDNELLESIFGPGGTGITFLSNAHLIGNAGFTFFF